MTGNVKNVGTQNRASSNSKKLTDAERHRRFVDMAKEVEAADDKGAFDKAFKDVVRPANPPRPSDSSGGRKSDPR